MAHVFISYVRQNKRLIDRLAKQLTDNGVSVWLDRNDLEPGVRWQNAIKTAIGDGAHFFACFSSQYLSRDKTYMNEELTIAIEELRQRRNKTNWFIPLLVNKTEIPNIRISATEDISSINFVYLYKDWEGSLKKILKAVCKDISADEVTSWSRPSIIYQEKWDRIFRSMVFKTKWLLGDSKRMHVQKIGKYISVKNSTNIHNHAKIVFYQELVGDFQIKLQIRGAYKDIQLQSANGEDRNFNCNPSSLGLNTHVKRTFIVTRLGNRLAFSTFIGRKVHNLRYENWQADPNMACFAAIVLANEDTVDIFSISSSTN